MRDDAPATVETDVVPGPPAPSHAMRIDPGVIEAAEAGQGSEVASVPSETPRPARSADPTGPVVDGTPIFVRGRAFHRRRWVRVVGGLVLVGLLYYGFNLFQVWRTGRSDQARATDAIVVMGAAQYDGRPSPQLEARLDHVLELWADGLAPVIVVTGGNRPGDRFTEAEASATYLQEHGVDPSAILEENRGRSSWESLQGVAGILRQRDARSVLLVSDPYHSLRIRLMAEDLGFTAYVSPTRTSPVQGATEVGKEMKEAAGVAVGRIIGFGRLLSITG